MAANEMRNQNLKKRKKKACKLRKSIQKIN